MFMGYWLFGICPLAGHTVQVRVRTVATIDEEPSNWKLFMVLFNTAFYIRTKVKYEKAST